MFCAMVPDMLAVSMQARRSACGWQPQKQVRNGSAPMSLARLSQPAKLGSASRQVQCCPSGQRCPNGPRQVHTARPPVAPSPSTPGTCKQPAAGPCTAYSGRQAEQERTVLREVDRPTVHRSSGTSPAVAPPQDALTAGTSV